jgi:predicted small secreted protein
MQQCWNLNRDDPDWRLSMHRKFFALAVLFGAMTLGVSALGGCSTVEGVGKDIQKGGEAIERAADRNKAD